MHAQASPSDMAEKRGRAQKFGEAELKLKTDNKT